MAASSTYHRIAGSLALLALVAIGAACESRHDLAAPSLTVATSGLQIVGPETVAPGSTAQYTVRLTSNGVVKTVVPERVRWGMPILGQMAATGIFTAGPEPGVTALSASVEGVAQPTVTFSIAVTPEGTFRLWGIVRDGTSGTGIAGATVTFEPGGWTTVTNGGGFYSLLGIPSAGDISVSASGYAAVTQPAGTTGNRRLDLTLPREAQPVRLSGMHWLHLEATGSCAGIPEDFHSRTYEASITQAGDRIDVALTEPRFHITNGFGNGFSGTARLALVNFSLHGYYNDLEFGTGLTLPSVTERLPDGRRLVFEGFFTAVPDGSGVSGSAPGVLTLYDSRFPEPAVALAACSLPIRFRLFPR